MPEMRIIHPGPFTTVQDLGRTQSQVAGFPASGALDRQAAEIGNALVNNRDEAAVLEFFLQGPTIYFTHATYIALTGAQLVATLDGQTIPMYRCQRVQAGQILTIGQLHAGQVAYLAVSGGVRVPRVLGSRSTTTRIQLGGLNGRILESGDRLPVMQCELMPAYYHRTTEALPLPDLAEPLRLRILKGPQWSWFDQATQAQFINSQYEVTKDADRMGYRLSGPQLPTPDKSMLSAATVFGGIQVPNGGQPIVLLADRQTTGGYPLIAVLATVDIRLLAQSRPGQAIQFELIDLEEAQALIRERSHSQSQLRQKFHKAYYQAPFGISRVAAYRIQQLFEE
ncbi:Allophanate hydrolase subunit 2 [Limosilactobacillus gastricus PS3]|uniref:Allophanate hydrolase subunit 2 n=1 Tax=Limosilactobacillus gastricus PS3 TaxID=1144300 RepID=H4GJC3_9LACO|nr:biotin-dependent carboxyltransferase family protein [Limosilactobacillus gastricus]EHS86992.1 Allophanate hydrolase subunit 2 [Limosilactobacillus gastricus PS3]